MNTDATAAYALDFEAIGAVDPSGILGDTLDLPEHLRDAAWRVDSAQIAAPDRCDGVIVAGMGGSAIGGSLARAMLGDEASLPFPRPATTAAAMGHAEHDWSSAPPTRGRPRRRWHLRGRRHPRARRVSWSRPAEAWGTRRVPRRSRHPGHRRASSLRAAVAYMVVAALEAAAMAGAGPRLRTRPRRGRRAPAGAGPRVGPRGPDDSLGKSLARAHPRDDPGDRRAPS